MYNTTADAPATGIAFSIREFRDPKKVYDSTTNEETWADSTANGKFITNDNIIKKASKDDWMLPKQEVTNLSEIILFQHGVSFLTIPPFLCPTSFLVYFLVFISM